jgi:hypothetical protein
MYQRSIFIKLVSFFFIVLMISAPITSLAQGTGDYLQGRTDGERDAKGNPLWVLAGLAGTGCCLLIGCAGIGAAYLLPPSPPAHVLIGKSPEYVLGYTEGYQSKAKVENTMYAAIGCAAAAVINLIINLALGNTSLSD